MAYPEPVEEQCLLECVRLPSCAARAEPHKRPKDSACSMRGRSGKQFTDSLGFYLLFFHLVFNSEISWDFVMKFLWGGFARK